MPRICGCPRNCKRRIRATTRHWETGKAGANDDPRARRPAIDPRSKQPHRAGCPDAPAPPLAVAPLHGRPDLRTLQMSNLSASASTPEASRRCAAVMRGVFARARRTCNTLTLAAS